MSPENIPKFLISQFTIEAAVNNIVRVGEEKLFVISEKSLKYREREGEGQVTLLHTTSLTNPLRHLFLPISHLLSVALVLLSQSLSRLS